MSSPHDHAEKQVAVEDVSASSHLELTTTTTTQGMDGSNYHDILPKPSNDPNDPLNWTWREKHVTLLLVAILSFQGGFDIASPSAGYVQQAETYKISVSSLIPATSVNAVCLGVGAFGWVPLAHLYGRRPVFLFSHIVATVGQLGAALAQNKSQFFAGRAINGLGASASFALGPQVVGDLFFVHERGMRMGIWTFFLTCSFYIAIFLDGYVTQYASWRWMQWLCFFMRCPMIILCVFGIPETLYERKQLVFDEPPPRQTYLQSFKWKKFNRKSTAELWYRPFLMFKYPSVLFIAFFWANMFQFITFGIMGSLPFAFPMIYGFDAVGQGLFSLSLLIGTILGEPMAGPFSDWVVRFIAKRRGDIRQPEYRLHALWPAMICMPVGLGIFGATLEYKTHWIGPCMGAGIASFGIQIVTTVSFAYAVDCYETRAAEVGLVMSFARQIFSFYILFYLPEFTEKVGYGWVYGTYAILTIPMFLLFVVTLMIWGATWRHKLGKP